MQNTIASSTDCEAYLYLLHKSEQHTHIASDPKFYICWN